MIQHELKIKEPFYNSLMSWEKTCEVRYNDRDYQKGDLIKIFEVLNSKWDVVLRYPDDSDFEITHVLHYPEGIKENWVVLSLKKI